METFAVSFPDATAAEANTLAEDLRARLQASGWKQDSIAVLRERSGAQDLGTILSIVLSSGAVIAFARGLSVFAAKSANRISVKLPTGESITVSGDATGHDKIADVIRAALGSK